MTTDLEQFVPQAEHWPIAHLEEYHGDREHESSSSLERFFRSRWGYYRWRVRGDYSPDSETEAKALGKGTHLALLEPYEWDGRIVPVDTGWQTKATKLVRQSCRPEQVVVTTEGLAAIQRMVEAVKACPAANDLIFEQPGRNEHAIRFTHPETGVKLKCCFDRLLDDGAIVDLKIARDASSEGFKRAVREYGYYRQAGLYSLGRDLYVGEAVPPGHYYVVVQNEEPYDCAVYCLSQRAIAHGREQVRSITQQIADLHAFGTPDLWHAEGHFEPSEIDLPEWEYNRSP